MCFASRTSGSTPARKVASTHPCLIHVSCSHSQSHNLTSHCLSLTHALTLSLSSDPIIISFAGCGFPFTGETDDQKHHLKGGFATEDEVAMAISSYFPNNWTTIFQTNKTTL